jgi:hypothetical protein
MLRPRGSGLPSDQINDILVASDGCVYVATQEGLGICRNNGYWRYLRGQDLRKMVQGLYAVPGSEQRKRIDAFVEAKDRWNQIAKRLPKADCINALADAGDGQVWLGYRRKGVGLFDARCRGELWHTPDSLNNDIISEVVAVDGRDVLLGCYQRGLYRLTASGKSNVVAFPRPARRPYEHDIGRMMVSLVDQLGAPVTHKYPYAEYLGEDWDTQGDWVGRYGADAAMLCAVPGLGNRTYGMCPVRRKWGYWVEAALGPNFRAGDGVRHWIHWSRSNQRRVLYEPLLGYRRQGEINDNGGGYSMEFDGPDLWLIVRLKKGMHRVSFYFINPNAHTWPNSMRDYMIEVRELHATPQDQDPVVIRHMKYEWDKQLKAPVLASSRVDGFYGGVYKTFLMQGPGEYAVKIDRNHGFNTIVSGIFIDRVSSDGSVLPWRSSAPLGGVCCVPPAAAADVPEETWKRLRYAPPAMELPQNAGLGLRSVVAMLKMLETHSGSSAYLRQRRRMSVMLYRSLLNIKGSEKIQENVRWNLPFMTDADRQSFDKNMAEGYRRHLMAEKLILGKQAKGSAGKDKPAPPNKPAPPPKVKPPPDKLPTPLQGAARPPQPSPKVKPPSNKLPIPLYGASRPKPPPEVKPPTNKLTITH